MSTLAPATLQMNKIMFAELVSTLMDNNYAWDMYLIQPMLIAGMEHLNLKFIDIEELPEFVVNVESVERCETPSEWFFDAINRSDINLPLAKTIVSQCVVGQ